MPFNIDKPTRTKPLICLKVFTDLFSMLKGNLFPQYQQIPPTNQQQV